MSYNIYTGILKMYDNFKSDDKEIRFTYDFNHPRYEELKNKYPIEEIAKDKDELSKVLNLLNWVSKNMNHKGDYDNHIPLNSIDLLEYSFGKKENGINCLGLSTILTEALLSIGFKARRLSIYPLSPYDFDNHVVTIVFLKSLNKWIMVDPTFNSYLLDENNQILSPWEAREILANQGTIKMNKDAFYNDEPFNYDERNKDYITYMAKDLFYMMTLKRNTFGNYTDDNKIYLCPKGFDVKKRFIENMKYRMNHIKFDTDDNDLKKIKQSKITVVSYETFTKKADSK